RPRRAAVSSFGISGTNAHLILEEDRQEPGEHHRNPRPDTTPAASAHEDLEVPVPWVVSAATETALRAQAARLVEYVEARPEAGAAETGLALGTTRAALGRRAVAVGRDRKELLDGMRAVAEGGTASNVVLGTPVTASPETGLAFLFSGQGSQRPGMGRELYAVYPVFAAAFDAVCGEVDRYLER
ncbi:ketoacyl-synthetase C-terminal extension domain-containing protein, partial [Streptomyces mangrovi]|uniref:ketoacyl-synthetase C-terminal extension domain-containing protein n=1 Tax=Streptomyces mangrovi TaxID=1206892 RepID=UPI00399CBACB